MIHDGITFPVSGQGSLYSTVECEWGSTLLYIGVAMVNFIIEALCQLMFLLVACLHFSPSDLLQRPLLSDWFLGSFWKSIWSRQHSSSWLWSFPRFGDCEMENCFCKKSKHLFIGFIGFIRWPGNTDPRFMSHSSHSHSSEPNHTIFHPPHHQGQICQLIPKEIMTVYLVMKCVFTH